MAQLVQQRGSAGPVNRGEQRVIDTLLAGLPDDFTVLPNIEIGEGGGRLWEFDAIVVAPHAVYALEVKDWRGEIAGDDREWQVDGRTWPAPTLGIARKAKVLKSKLVSHAPVLESVWVDGAVVLASPPVSLKLTREAGERVFALGKAIGYLIDPSRLGQRPFAIQGADRLVVEALKLQAKPRQRPLRFGQYVVVEAIEEGATESVYLAMHEHMAGAPPVRLRIVTLPPFLSPRERKERLAALHREAEALRRMGSHPNVIAARDVFQDESGGRIVTVLDGTEGRSLRQRLADGTPMTVHERLEVLADVARALAHAHAHGVIHRRVEPASVLLADDGTAKLGHFDLAKITAPGAATVWISQVAEDLDPSYVAPELLNPNLGSPTPATDLYGLGCIAYELFAGKPPFDHPSRAFKPLADLPPGVPGPLAILIPKLLDGDPRNRPSDTKGVLQVLEDLRRGESRRPITGPKERYEAGDFIDGKFRVLERLGTGGLSNVYRVFNPITDQEYALKVFNSDVDHEKVKREFTLLSQVNHPAVVRAVWADTTKAGQWYLLTELVRGDPLDVYTRGEKRLSVERAVWVVCELLKALEAIHPNAKRIAELSEAAKAGEITAEDFDELQRLRGEGIVHRDIKPHNVMLMTSGVKLIDFNISSRVGQAVMTVSGTPPYQSPDIVPGAETWDVSPDLFAAGVVLYELICSDHPYEGNQPRTSAQPRDPREARPNLAPGLAEAMVRACRPFRDERYATALEMRLALESLDELTREATYDEVEQDRALSQRLRDLLDNAPANVNPFVREFLALSSQARRSNKGTRGLDELAAATYVPTKLDVDLGASVLRGEHSLVIITGNAGDGKTAFLQRVEEDAVRRGAVFAESGPNGSRLQAGAIEIRTLYDGSQDEQDRSSDEVLARFFEPYGVGPGPVGVVSLAAINEGRLRDFCSSRRTELPTLAVDILALLDDPSNESTQQGLVIVNLNARSLTAGVRDSIFSHQLRAIVDGPFWGPCEGCDYRVRCPIKHNVDTFRDPTSGPEVTERLRTMVDLVRLRRRRHLTMRDVRSLISHLLFRDRVCEEIPDLLASDDPFAVLDLAYFQGPGGQGVPEGSTLERGAALLGEVDVALVANPIDDRALARGHGPLRLDFPSRSGDYPADLIKIARHQAGSGYEANPQRSVRVHRTSRRQAFFERLDDDWRAMLPYQRLREFLDALGESSHTSTDDLLVEIVAAISMYEGMRDEQRARAALWLSTADDPDRELSSFRRFRAGEFRLDPVAVPVPFVERAPDHLVLVHDPTGASLVVDLDLLEVLERLAEGYVPSVAEGRGVLVNLALFKNRLLASPSRELVIATPDGSLLRIEALASRPGAVALTQESA